MISISVHQKPHLQFTWSCSTHLPGTLDSSRLGHRVVTFLVAGPFMNFLEGGKMEWIKMQECLEEWRNIRTKNRTLVFIVAMTVEIVFFKGSKTMEFSSFNQKVSLFKMDVSENRGTPKSSILKGFSIIFTIHFGDFPIFGNTQIPFFGWNHEEPVAKPDWLKVSGCGVLALWQLDVEKVHVAKASSTDGHRVWLLLRWGIFLAERGEEVGRKSLQNYDYFNYFTHFVCSSELPTCFFFQKQSEFEGFSPPCARWRGSFGTIPFDGQAVTVAQVGRAPNWRLADYTNRWWHISIYIYNIYILHIVYIPTDDFSHP